MIKIIETETTAHKLIKIECPKCKSKNSLKIPKKVINLSKQLTTVSIPSELVCEHSFQAFVDKNFRVRGYQNVDFEISNMEYLEYFDEKEEKSYDIETDHDSLLPFLQNIIVLLRSCVNDEEILGSAIFTIQGKVLYSSLEIDTLSNIINEFEVRNEKKLILVKKLFLVLENDQKICSEFTQIHGENLIIVLVFAESVKLGMGNFYLKDLLKKIENIK